MSACRLTSTAGHSSILYMQTLQGQALRESIHLCVAIREIVLLHGVQQGVRAAPGSWCSSP